MSNEPSDAAKSPDAPQEDLPSPPVENQTPEAGGAADEAASAETQRQRILIGSQRDPAAYLADPRRTRAPVVGPETKQARRRGRDRGPRRAAAADASNRPDTAEDPAAGQGQPATVGPVPAADRQPVDAEPPPVTSPPADSAPLTAPAASPAPAEDTPPTPERSALPPEASAMDAAPATHEAPATERVLPPNIREPLPADLEAELNEALGGAAVETFLEEGDAAATRGGLEPDSKHTGRVLAVRREDVFVELGSREQGIASLRQFAEAPEPGTPVEVIVRGFNREDGFYELNIPGQAEDVADWSDLREGMVVTAQITGHNAGGLECEVNHIRGFIPVSQVSLHRVEGLEQFLGEQWTCLVTEANPQRGNLVLSRRAILEREREEARQKLFESLAPGQVYEGVVRKILDFGAFVELDDGVDGLLHISQLSWGRVEHPRDVLAEGQRIKVKIEKIDPETRKIGLTYRDLFENPWTDAEKQYPENTVVRGTVTKLMDFGAFVELEPGVEGLVHISELSHKHVWRAGDVVREGQEVEALVLSVDSQAERIGLSMKQLVQPEPVKQEADDGDAAAEPEKSRKSRQPSQPLKGGLGRSSGGASFGLKW